MTIITSIPILFMLIGAILWLMSEKTGKWAELGRILFAAGAFGICFALSGKTVALLK
jgi:Na+/phosphate symporter